MPRAHIPVVTQERGLKGAVIIIRDNELYGLEGSAIIVRDNDLYKDSKVLLPLYETMTSIRSRRYCNDPNEAN